MKRRALITGISGQDGSYLAELLLEKDYQVFGMVRRSSNGDLTRIKHLLGDIELVQGDMLDHLSLVRILQQVRPMEVYNLAAQSFVPTSWDQPVLTAEFNSLGVTRLLEAIRMVDTGTRFFQASSSEMFGKVRETPQTERTPFHPRSPYGVSKTHAHYITVNYREGYGLFACCGIMFNHESPRRGKEFVSAKIAEGAARIKLGYAHDLRLGNIEARRDWGYAKDYVVAMWLMLQEPEPDDYVIATGEHHSVGELAQRAFEYVGLDWRDFVIQDPALLRPAEVDHLVGDSTKARTRLGWRPQVSFRELVEGMVAAEMGALEPGSGERRSALPAPLKLAR